MKRIAVLTPFLVLLSASQAYGQGDPLAPVAPMPAAGPVAAPASGGDGFRPIPTSLGLGFGWGFPGAEVWQPNSASARIVLSDSLILEPRLNLRYDRQSVDNSAGVTQSNSVLTTGVDVGVRWLLMSRGPIDLAALVGAGLSNTVVDAANDTNSQRFGINWGVGLAWYLYKNWSMSLDVLNPLFILDRTSVDGGNTTSRITAGAMFQAAPSVLVMFHLFF